MDENNSTYTIEQRGTAFVVIDSLDYLCGIFNTAAQAEEAVPKIHASIKRGFIHDWLLKLWQQRRHTNRPQSKQVSKNKYTPRPTNTSANK